MLSVLSRAWAAVTVRITITEDDGNVFIDVAGDDDRDVSVFEAVGIIEAGKLLVLGQVP